MTGDKTIERSDRRATERPQPRSGTAGDVRAPDCRGSAAPPALTPAERRELVLRIAEEGPGAIEAWVRERAKSDSTIARRVAALRDELLRRAEELRRRVAGRAAERTEAAEADWRAAWDRLEGERAAVEAELVRVRAGRGGVLEAAAADAELVRLLEEAADPSGLPWWRRLGLWLRRLWRRLVALVLWPLRAIARALGLARPTPGYRGRPVTLGRLGRLRGPGFGEALAADPRLRRAVKRRLRAMPPRERMRAAWDRLLGRDDYEALVARLAERDLEEAAQRRDADLARREETFAAKLQEVLDAERAAQESREQALERIRREAEEDARRLEAMLKEQPERDAAEAVARELEQAGLLARDAGGALQATARLVERFAELFYAEESRKVRPAEARAAGLTIDGTGVLVREPLRAPEDVSHMDTVATLVNARTRHPHVRRLYEEDVIVYREQRETSDHVVVVLDRSGSMEEGGRMEAAKRAVLALWHGVKRANRRNVVEVVVMDTRVARAGLEDVWNAEPKGFTNTGAALRLAGELLRRSPASRGVVYLVTDGLPEAYTTPEGVDVAGHPDKAMAYALEQARRLRLGAGPEVAIVLLEPDDARYVKAAERLAREVGGTVHPVRPADLGVTLLREFEARPAVRAR